MESKARFFFVTHFGLRICFLYLLRDQYYQNNKNYHERTIFWNVSQKVSFPEGTRMFQKFIGSMVIGSMGYLHLLVNG